ncbi:MAG: HD domain-containing protein [Chloroflexota bacterium]
MAEKDDLAQSSYAGRWIARVRGQVVAQGGTPEQARRAAKVARHKESPEISYMPTLQPLTFSPMLDSVRSVLPEGLAVYLVGGAVRDAVQGRSTHDLDFAVKDNAIQVARGVADALEGDFYTLDPERDTGRVIISTGSGERMVMDFASFRGPDLETDLQGRDFTLNALAVDVHTRSLFDPLNGIADLKAGELRYCSPSAFQDDPLRVLRGVRLAAEFGFHIQPETRRAMKAAVGGLEVISAERLRDEIFRILEGPRPATCLRALDILGALALVLPELAAQKGVQQPPPHLLDVWNHTLAVLDYLDSILAALSPSYDPESAADFFYGLLVLKIGRYRQQLGEHFTQGINLNRSLRSLVFFAALYHDIAKPECLRADDEGQPRFWGHDQAGAAVAAKRARRLALSNDEVERIESIVANHMRILFHADRLLRENKEPSRRAIYRFFRDTDTAGVELCLLALADLRATYGSALAHETWTACLEIVRLFLENWYEKRPESILPPSLINGEDLMRALDLPPGPRVGELLEAVREAQAMGQVATKEEALVFAREWGQ